MKYIYSNKFLFSNDVDYSGSIYKKIILVLLGSVILGVSAHIYIPTYPVPFTMQSLMVMLIASSLGRKLAVCTILLYILEAFAGLPVTTIKSAGISLFISPSFGYVIGYIFMAYIIGLMKDKSQDANILTSFSYIFLGNQLMFFVGVLFLSYFLGNTKQAFLLGYIPFVIFDLIKVVIATLSVRLFTKF